MQINFDNIIQNVIPIDDFRLKWRFTEEEYNKLPTEDLKKLKPLNNDAAEFLWKFIADSDLHNNFPFKKEFFKQIESVKIENDNESEIRKWLFNTELSLEKSVFLSWQPADAMIVPFEILIKYFDSFYYGSSDDLTVFDQSLNWALLFFHEDEIYYGKSDAKS